MFDSTDDNKHVNGAGTKDGAAVNEQVDAWTAHKTDTGVVYYYNALTGESTYEKPSDFKGEVPNTLYSLTNWSQCCALLEFFFNCIFW